MVWLRAKIREHFAQRALAYALIRLTNGTFQN